MITIIIIAITVLFSYKGFQEQSFFYKFDFAPYRVKHNKEYFRFVSHAFLHGDWSHLFFNMFVLYNFGGVTQANFEYYQGDINGMFYFIMLYLGGIVFATLPTFKKHKNNSNYHSIGASGAVSAVLFSSIIFSPTTSLYLLLIPFPIPGIILGIAYLAYEQYQAKRSNGNINHDAHIAGAIFGIVFTIITNPSAAVNFYYQIIAYLN